MAVDRTVQRFNSFDAAAAADRAYYRSLTPQARVDLLLDLVARYQEGTSEAERRLERVCRVVKRTRG